MVVYASLKILLFWITIQTIHHDRRKKMKNQLLYCKMPPF
ncbi:hypothetical protein HMPREF0083_01270 [Aneurinibacillus aneurinilyticus ATCC 12856]|uniref:Uncharacterized protein n=1 Tax=Aneurinibacillus aneurinilyticus ATCC 12856 TaxID=649747 RepID=U1YIM3_ANEAE|nr:hypothetical protein HMPREF0083_01270 [Aneurinibacillus aneurinilyticus ATCC 12856]